MSECVVATPDEVAGRRVGDALRLRRRPGRVHQEQQVLAVHRLAGARRGVVGDACREVVVPVVAAVGHRHLVARPPDDERGPHAGRVGHRLVRDALQRHRLAAPPRLVLGDEHLAAHVVHPVGQRVGREASEDDRVRRAEARAREHRDRELRHHPHVDRDRGALADADLLQRVRHPHDVALELGVGDRRASRPQARPPSDTRRGRRARPRRDGRRSCRRRSACRPGTTARTAAPTGRARANGSNHVTRSRPLRSQNASNGSS